MDRLDTISAAFIVILACIAVFLIVHQVTHPEPEQEWAAKKGEAVRIINPEFDQKVKVAKNLIENNNLDDSEKLLNDLIAGFPYDGRPYILRGDLFMRKQLPIDAMLEYKKGVDLNPDFLDKKTKLFQGKKIKITMQEAKTAIFSGLERDPANEQLRQHRKTLYYMLRKIAGSCG